jgi:hypothetical protein
LAAVLVALGVLAYLYYERTKPVVKIDVPGVSGEITKEGVDVEIGEPKNQAYLPGTYVPSCTKRTCSMR